MSGWVKIHRKFSDWGWRSKPEMVSLFLHMLCEANYEDAVWCGVSLRRGQCVFGRLTWAKALGISEQSLRTCISKLKSTNEITIESTNKYSVITIVNYEEYQDGENKSTSKKPGQSTSNPPTNQQTTNKQITTPKEEKEIKKVVSNIPPSPQREQLDLIPDETKKENKPKNSRNLQLDEITVELLGDWVKKNIKAPIDIQRELLKCQSWDFKRTIKDGMATVRTWLLKAEDDYFKALTTTGKVNKHGNFEQQDYRAGVKESGFKTGF